MVAGRQQRFKLLYQHNGSDIIIYIWLARSCLSPDNLKGLPNSCHQRPSTPIEHTGYSMGRECKMCGEACCVITFVFIVITCIHIRQSKAAASRHSTIGYFLSVTEALLILSESFALL